MEKRKAHYDLKKVQSLVREGRWSISFTARRNAWEELDLDEEGIKKIIFGLSSRFFINQ
jgi:hypothetical protein